MRGSTIKRATATWAVLALGCACWFGFATPASAAPRWDLGVRSNSAAAPNSDFDYGLTAVNTGDAPVVGTLTLTAELPEGITALAVSSGSTPSGAPWTCTGNGPGAPPKVSGASSLTCTLTDIFGTGAVGGSQVRIRAHVAALAEGSVRVAQFAVYAPGSSLRDGTSCAGSPSGVPCASIPDPIRIDSTSHFGFEGADTQIEGLNGEPDTRAGVHPYAQAAYFDLQTERNENADVTGDNDDEAWPVESVRDVLVELPPGFVGDPAAIPACTLDELVGGNCPDGSQVGMNRLRFSGASGAAGGIPASNGLNVQKVFNMVAAPGYAARLGFNVVGTLVLVDVALKRGDDYGLIAGTHNTPPALAITGNDLTVWGTTPGGKVFLRSPTSCGRSLVSEAHANSWPHPGAFRGDGSPDLSDPAWDSVSSTSHKLPGFPHLPSEWGEVVTMQGCERVPVKGNLTALPTTIDAETPSGLAVHLEVPNPGLENPDGISASDLKKVEVTLPEGMTINPSQAEGLGACSPAQYQSTELSFHPTPGRGCPDDAKIGSVEVKTPLLEETIPGDVYIAKPYDNPFGSLLALYVVLHEPQRGIFVRLAGRVDTDPRTGQLTTIFDDLPQTPFSTFDFKFREGARAPLVTPQACGTYETTARIWGHSDPNGTPITSKSSFEVTSGIGGSACPTGGLPPFEPGILAGTRSNAAGSFSPFDLRLFRTDAEQQFTNFSIKLPPGVTGKLAGIPFCSDQAIAAAKAREGQPSGGGEELESPSCPSASQIGRTLVGAGVGSVQTYVPGKVYLAGPYNGSQLSIVAITAAKVGPFDLGTVVVRYALKINPETAEVFIDATGSDPLPHIIRGIPTKLRDIRAYVDRPGFVLNPTSCAPTSVASTVLGSGADFASSGDDVPVTVTSRFQAADCGSLNYKPRLSLKLRGGTRRGKNPQLTAILRPRPGDANSKRISVALPHSEFLDQSHIRTICTRVQFKAGDGNGSACPKGSVYGTVKAWTPLLEKPLAGNVYLRSSEHPLPDLVMALHGLVDFTAVGRIDSVKGGIRNTFEAIPDAPITKVEVRFRGGKKGLLINSTNICKGRHRANLEYTAHSGKRHNAKAPLQARACKRRNAKKRKGHSRRAQAKGKAKAAGRR